MDKIEEFRNSFLSEAQKQKIKSFVQDWLKPYLEEDINTDLYALLSILHEQYALEEILESFINVTQPLHIDLNAWRYAEIIETDFGNYKNRYGFDIPESLEDSLKIIVYSHMISFIEKNINNWR